MKNLHENPISGASNSGVKIWKQKLVQMGAKIETQLSDKITHVFAISSDALLHRVNEDQLARFKGISRKKMSCFPCFNPRSKDSRIDIDNGSRTTSRHFADSSVSSVTRRKTILEEHKKGSDHGHGSKGNGRIIVAVKQLNHDRLQGYQEFIVEVLMLSLLNHVNLVTLIDLEPGQEPLSWNNCIKIAVGAARGIEYLHCKLITGRKAIDTTKKHGEHNLVSWSRPYLKDQKKFSLLVDPLIRGCYPHRCLNYAIAITAMCLNEEANFRPLIGVFTVVTMWAVVVTEGCREIKLQYCGFKLAFATGKVSTTYLDIDAFGGET
ncbi:hypothetical protein F3Y22_tig00111105pilonHSYRG00157 [Hibiscus syriacus]|uniref:Tyrosine-protein kinase catalytic domain-containing protein n=1 Tax=Hibiscus syriacus TaxID=106335 RepID=A0A6A2YYL7_HIBSY|nr:hypothetical protein F3Y22_tig00111105pilonHSYRG00157 [Hibiscus syriacus]